MKSLLCVVFLLLLFGCVPQHCPIELTRAGSKVPLLGVILVNDIPGQPLSKCTVLAQIRLYSDARSECWYDDPDWNNALRNRTAAMMGNVAIFSTNEHFFLSPSMYKQIAIQGMALFCSPEALKSAGLTDSVNEPIEASDANYSHGRSRYNDNSDESSSEDVGKKGVRRRSNSD